MAKQFVAAQQIPPSSPKPDAQQNPTTSPKPVAHPPLSPVAQQSAKRQKTDDDDMPVPAKRQKKNMTVKKIRLDCRSVIANNY